jgi:hypothetical protein
MNRVYVAVALLAIGGGLIAARRRRAVPGSDWERESELEMDGVTLASDDSFPASDPPSFTPLAGSQTGVAGGVR